MTEQREPEAVIGEVIDLSKRIDRLYGDVKADPARLWMGRPAAQLKLERKGAQADLPPLALVAS